MEGLVLTCMYVNRYIGSRIYLHNPPGDGNALSLPANAPEALKEKERETEVEQPKLNQWTCLIAFLFLIPLLAVTAEWVGNSLLFAQILFPVACFERLTNICTLDILKLVDSLEKVRETSNIKEEWFGLILLPVVSFSGEALVTILYYVKKAIITSNEAPPSELANGRTIDLSIQFTMFWMPLLILIAWWTNKPLFLLFGTCLLLSVAPPPP